MPFYVYIIYSPSKDRYYIGSCENTQIRINQHNSGRNKSTKHCVPWIFKKIEEYSTLAEARKRETYIKKMKSRKFIEMVIDGER